MSPCVKSTLCSQKCQKSTPPLALNPVLNCFSCALAVTRDSEAHFSGFLSCWHGRFSPIVQSTCYKMCFNLNTVYAYAPYTHTRKQYNGEQLMSDMSNIMVWATPFLRRPTTLLIPFQNTNSANSVRFPQSRKPSGYIHIECIIFVTI